MKEQIFRHTTEAVCQGPYSPPRRPNQTLISVLSAPIQVHSAAEIAQSAANWVRRLPSLCSGCVIQAFSALES